MINQKTVKLIWIIKIVLIMMTFVAIGFYIGYMLTKVLVIMGVSSERVSLEFLSTLSGFVSGILAGGISAFCKMYTLIFRDISSNITSGIFKIYSKPGKDEPSMVAMKIEDVQKKKSKRKLSKSEINRYKVILNLKLSLTGNTLKRYGAYYSIDSLIIELEDKIYRLVRYEQKKDRYSFKSLPIQGMLLTNDEYEMELMIGAMRMGGFRDVFGKYDSGTKLYMTITYTIYDGMGDRYVSRNQKLVMGQESVEKTGTGYQWKYESKQP